MSVLKHRLIGILAAAVAALVLFTFASLPAYSETGRNILHFIAWVFVAVAVLGAVMIAIHAWRNRSRRP